MSSQKGIFDNAHPYNYLVAKSDNNWHFEVISPFAGKDRKVFTVHEKAQKRADELNTSRDWHKYYPICDFGVFESFYAVEFKSRDEFWRCLDAKIEGVADIGHQSMSINFEDSQSLATCMATFDCDVI